jgi:hypothetical protein
LRGHMLRRRVRTVGTPDWPAPACFGTRRRKGQAQRQPKSRGLWERSVGMWLASTGRGIAGGSYSGTGTRATRSRIVASASS